MTENEEVYLLGEGDDKVEQTKTFPVKVAPKTEAGIIAAVKALADGEAIGNSATLTGTVTSIVDEYALNTKT